MCFHAPPGDALRSTALGAARARSFAVPPWHLLTLVPRARPSIGMAADATFQCRTTDSRASLACFRHQLESSATRSVTPASFHWSPTRRGNLNVISIRRDPRLVVLAPFRLWRRLHATIVCYAEQTDSKYHEGAGLEPAAWSHVSPKSPIAPKMELPQRAGGLHSAFPARCSSTHCVTPWEAVMHHKASRPFLRNPRSQLLINPAPPRVQTNKPQPCWPHVTSASAWSAGQPPSLSDASGRSAGEEAQVKTSQPDALYNLYWPKKSFFGRMLPPSPRAPSHLVFQFSLMSKTGHGARAELLGVRPSLTRRTTSVDKTEGLSHQR